MRIWATIVTIDIIMSFLLLLSKICIYDIVIIGYYLGWYSFFSYFFSSFQLFKIRT